MPGVLHGLMLMLIVIIKKKKLVKFGQLNVVRQVRAPAGMLWNNRLVI